MLDLVVENKMNASVAYIAEPIFLWHARLGHVNNDSIKRPKQLSLVPTFSDYAFDKYELCVAAKCPKKPFNKNVN